MLPLAICSHDKCPKIIFKYKFSSLIVNFFTLSSSVDVVIAIEPSRTLSMGNMKLLRDKWKFNLDE